MVGDEQVRERGDVRDGEGEQEDDEKFDAWEADREDDRDLQGREGRTGRDGMDEQEKATGGVRREGKRNSARSASSFARDMRCSEAESSLSKTHDSGDVVVVVVWFC